MRASSPAHGHTLSSSPDIRLQSDPPLDVALQCPRCRADLNGLVCASCEFQMRISGGIVHALPPERASHYARFMEDYERIRAAEGRGSEGEEFYLSLPYSDVTGRNSKQWDIRGRSYDYLVRHVLPETGPTEGRRILDLGAGNCWMSFRLALAATVHAQWICSPTTGTASVPRSTITSTCPHPFLGFKPKSHAFPFRDKQFDAVIFNASFHYAEDYTVTLREALRCVKIGGLVIISDTPWYSREESGRQMVTERRAAFSSHYGTASDSINSREFLTTERLQILEKQLSIKWTTHSPWYGLRWAMRPLVAKLQRKREPSRFRIYVARKDA